MQEKSINIILPTGNPREEKRAELQIMSLEVTQYSRAYLNKNNSLNNFKGIYILLDDIDAEKPEIYIGKGDVKARLKQHDKNKDFWNYCITVESTSRYGFSESYIAYLEYYFINKAKTLKMSVNKENKQKPSEPSLSNSDLINLKEYAKNIELLFNTIGLRVFDDLIEDKSKEDIFICKDSLGSDAKGIYSDKGFVILKGAKIKSQLAKSLGSNALLEKLDKENKIALKDGIYVLKEDIKVSSPSAASKLVLGRSSNGWTDWKSKDGKTLSEVYRKDY